MVLLRRSELNGEFDNLVLRNDRSIIQSKINDSEYYLRPNWKTLEVLSSYSQGCEARIKRVNNKVVVEVGFTNVYTLIILVTFFVFIYAFFNQFHITLVPLMLFLIIIRVYTILKYHKFVKSLIIPPTTKTINNK